MTSERYLHTEEGSGPGGFCQAPQLGERWTQGLTVPVQCFKVEMVVHQDPSLSVYCHAFEVSDPHTKELLAKWVDPSRPHSAVLPLASSITVELRGVLLALTDPDPF